MSEPLPNAFIGRAQPPSAAEVDAALGPAAKAWRDVLDSLEQEHGPIGHEWKSYSPKVGWALRVLRKKRTIVWLSPAEARFNVTFVLGDKAMLAARAAKLPAEVKRTLATAPKYPEGTGVRLVVKSAALVPALRALAAIKMAN